MCRSYGQRHAIPVAPFNALSAFRARILSRFRGNKSGFRRERLSAQRPQRIRPSGQYPAVRHTYLPDHSASGKAVLKETSPLRLHHAHRGTDSDGCPPHHASLSKDHMSVFWEMGEFEGEGEVFLQKILPIPHHTKIAKLVPDGGPGPPRHRGGGPASFTPQKMPPPPTNPSLHSPDSPQ